MTQPANRDDDLRGDDPYATWDAAYVLGSLSGNERREFEAHLATCPRCRAAVAELSGIPALLAQLDRRGSGSTRRPGDGSAAAAARGARHAAAEGRVARRRTRRLSVIDAGRRGRGAGRRPGGRDSARHPRAAATTTADGIRGDDEQGRADADQRDHHADRLRLGHPHRHGLHLRRLCEPTARRTPAESGDGRGGPRRQLRARSRRGSGCPVRPRCPAATRRCRRTKSQSVQLVSADTERCCCKQNL